MDNSSCDVTGNTKKIEFFPQTQIFWPQYLYNLMV